MKIIEKDIDQLVEYENNPRNNDDAVEKVAESIRNFGFKVPVIVDKNNVIVAGHTRLKAARQLGLEVVPCIVANDLTEDQVKAFRLADNKVSEFSTWDFEALELEIQDINIDMTSFGFEACDNEEQKHENEEDLSDDVKEAYQVIVECSDEGEQEQVYNKLISEGMKCRVLTL